MLRQYCFLNASETKISSRHSLKAGSITTQHLMEVAALEPTNQHMWYVTKKNTKKLLNFNIPENAVLRKWR